jgi:hypothetical protein
MYLKADCPNRDCDESGYIYFEERCFRAGYFPTEKQSGWRKCPDCEGKKWVVLDLEIILSEDRGRRPGAELYESVKKDIKP